MDTSRSDSLKIIEYVKIKDLPQELSVIDPEVLCAFMDQTMIRIMAKLRHATMRSIREQLISIDPIKHELLNQRAIQMAAFGTEPWTEVDYQARWYLTRDLVWVRVKAMTTGRITEIRTFSTEEFME